MTDLDKQAAARLVAERIGYTVVRAAHGWINVVRPDGEPYLNLYDTEEEAWQAIERHFPLFAHSAAGALAREEARKWLVDKWYTFDSGKCIDNWKGYYCEVTPPDCKAANVRLITNQSLEMAEAIAICNAVRGMREDKDG